MSGLICTEIQSDDHLRSLIIDHDIVSIQATFSLRHGMMDALRILNELEKVHIVCLRTSYRHIPFSRLAHLNQEEKNMLLDTFGEYLRSKYCYLQTVSHCFGPTLEFLHVKKEYTTIYNAKDWDMFLSPTSNAVPKVDITYVGEISWMKGLHVLLTALPQIRKSIPHVSIRIIGNGQDRGSVQAIVESCEIPHVEFIEYVENNNLAPYLRATGILVVPSLTETWCNLVMEALGCGTRIVAADVEGLSELLEQGRLGTLFEIGNASDLADKVITTLHSNIHSDYSTYIQEKFSLEKRTYELEKFYSKLLTPHNSSKNNE